MFQQSKNSSWTQPNHHEILKNESIDMDLVVFDTSNSHSLNPTEMQSRAFPSPHENYESPYPRARNRQLKEEHNYSSFKKRASSASKASRDNIIEPQSQYSRESIDDNLFDWRNKRQTHQSHQNRVFGSDFPEHMFSTPKRTTQVDAESPLEKFTENCAKYEKFAEAHAQDPKTLLDVRNLTYFCCPFFFEILVFPFFSL